MNPDQELQRIMADHEEMRTTLAVVKEKVLRLDDAMFGNGRPGLKEEVVKLRQALRIASAIGAIICAVMVGEFLARFYDTKPEDVKNAVEVLEKKIERITRRLPDRR